MYKKLVFGLAVAFVSTGALAQELPEIIDSGSCGENEGDCSWSVDATGKLNIWGTGEMSDFEDGSERPWNEWNDDITQIEMSGITKIGKHAFPFRNVEKFTVPATVEILGENCFPGMFGLTNITFEEDSRLKRIEGYAFANARKLQNLELPDSVEYIGYTEFWDTGIRSLVLPESLFKDGKIGLNETTFLSGMTLYCPKEHQQECEDYLKTATGLKIVDGKNTYPLLENMTLQTYEKDGDGYFINGSWYKHPNDVLTGKRIKKLRYTVEEAMKATENGDKFHVRLTYK